METATMIFNIVGVVIFFYYGYITYQLKSEVEDLKHEIDRIKNKPSFYGEI